MKYDDTLPGVFPIQGNPTAITRRASYFSRNKNIDDSNGRLVLKSHFTSKLSKYFSRKKRFAAVKERSSVLVKISKWKKAQKTEKAPLQVQHHNTIVGLTIQTTNHYHNSTDSMSHKSATSIVQQFIVLPPFQAYWLMFVMTLFLLIVAFALFQIHRSLSIIKTVVDGIKYTLVALTSNSTALFSWLKSWL